MKPPGHTCPGIDRAQSTFRRLARRATMTGGKTATAPLVADGLAALERVRDENTRMRAAHANTIKRFDSALARLRHEASLAEGCGLLTSPERLRELVALMEAP